MTGLYISSAFHPLLVLPCNHGGLPLPSLAVRRRGILSRFDKAENLEKIVPKIVIRLDNASFHKKKEIVEYLKKTPIQTNPVFNTLDLKGNILPILSSITKTGTEYLAIAFTNRDFSSAFSDDNGDSLTKIKITFLPNNGILKLDQGIDQVSVCERLSQIWSKAQHLKTYIWVADEVGVINLKKWVIEN